MAKAGPEVVTRVVQTVVQKWCRKRNPGEGRGVPWAELSSLPCLYTVLPCTTRYTSSRVHHAAHRAATVIHAARRGCTGLGGTAWAQRALLSLGKSLPRAILPRVVTVLREERPGDTGRVSDKRMKDWIAAGQSEPYTGLSWILAEEAGFLGFRGADDKSTQNHHFCHFYHLRAFQCRPVTGLRVIIPLGDRSRG